MKDRYDVIIIGAGSAGVSAALTLINRGKSVAVIMNGSDSGSLVKAEIITNYPGLFNMTGREMTELFHKQLIESGADIIKGRALSVMANGSDIGVAVGSDFYMGSALIIAAGITREKLYKGEAEFLGRGVSYCATCDGMLYRGKTVAVVGNNEEAGHDADFLESIGCTVYRYPQPGSYEISGEKRVNALSFRGETKPVDAVFIIKDSVSVTNLVPGLQYEGGCIVTDRKLRTNIQGVFAAGDCTGKPYQIAKAVGEGNVAALSACEYLDSLK